MFKKTSLLQIVISKSPIALLCVVKYAQIKHYNSIYKSAAEAKNKTINSGLFVYHINMRCIENEKNYMIKNYLKIRQISFTINRKHKRETSPVLKMSIIQSNTERDTILLMC